MATVPLPTVSTGSGNYSIDIDQSSIPNILQEIKQELRGIGYTLFMGVQSPLTMIAANVEEMTKEFVSRSEKRDTDRITSTLNDDPEETKNQSILKGITESLKSFTTKVSDSLKALMPGKGTLGLLAALGASLVAAFKPQWFIDNIVAPILDLVNGTSKTWLGKTRDWIKTNVTDKLEESWKGLKKVYDKLTDAFGEKGALAIALGGLLLMFGAKGLLIKGIIAGSVAAGAAIKNAFSKATPKPAAAAGAPPKGADLVKQNVQRGSTATPKQLERAGLVRGADGGLTDKNTGRAIKADEVSKRLDKAGVKPIASPAPSPSKPPKAPEKSKLTDPLKKFKNLAKFAKIPGIAQLLALGDVVSILSGDGSIKEKVSGLAGVIGGLGGSALGALFGATVGSVVPVAGNIIGGILGSIGGYFAGDAVAKGLAEWLLDQKVTAFPEYLNKMINGGSPQGGSVGGATKPLTKSDLGGYADEFGGMSSSGGALGSTARTPDQIAPVTGTAAGQTSMSVNTGGNVSNDNRATTVVNNYYNYSNKQNGASVGPASGYGWVNYVPQN